MFTADTGGPMRHIVPFLALGSVIALFWGETLIHAYLRLTT